MLTGGTEQPSHVPDQRIQNVIDLPSGPFQLTSKSFPYDSYAASPVHRFYQMWQQEDCNIKYATAKNPSGCKADLFPWVEVTVGAGTNGKPLPVNFNNRTTGEGSTSMAFYNVQEGDAPYLKYLADTYSMSDNYHQPVMGGTGANSIMLGFGDAIFFSDSNGNPAKPPENVHGLRRNCRMPVSSTRLRIPILSPAPTTGTPKTATAGAALDAAGLRRRVLQQLLRLRRSWCFLQS